MNSRFRLKWDHFFEETYPRYAGKIAFFTLLVALFAALGVSWLTYVQGQEQERARDREETARLARVVLVDTILECFDTYASANSNVSKATRPATVAVSDAQTDVTRATMIRDRALQTAFVSAIENPNITPEQVEALVQDFIDANGLLLELEDTLILAQENLSEVREQNPVVDPPSTFCKVQP